MSSRVLQLPGQMTCTSELGRPGFAIRKCISTPRQHQTIPQVMCYCSLLKINGTGSRIAIENCCLFLLRIDRLYPESSRPMRRMTTCNTRIAEPTKPTTKLPAVTCCDIHPSSCRLLFNLHLQTSPYICGTLVPSHIELQASAARQTSRGLHPKGFTPSTARVLSSSQRKSTLGKSRSICLATGGGDKPPSGGGPPIKPPGGPNDESDDEEHDPDDDEVVHLEEASLSLLGPA